VVFTPREDVAPGLRFAAVRGGRSVAGMVSARLVPFLCFFLGTLVVRAGETSLERYHRVEIAPTRTSIYLGSVSMTMPTFVRANGVYSADYSAKVFPFFFYNETGRLAVEISDAALRRLERGEPIEFEGHGISSDGKERRLAGRAVPTNTRTGKIKVRVFLSKRIQLIFNTTYRFVE
jgi:hypothetical protein